MLFFLYGAAGKKYQPSAPCSSAIYLDANLWLWWLKGFQGRVSFCLGGLEGGKSSWSSYKILCIENPLEENLEDLHHLSM